MKLRTDGASVDIDGDYTETLARIESDPNGIGVFGLAFYENNTSVLKVATMSGVAPSTETIASGEYPVSRPLFFYVKKAHIGEVPGLQEFAEFFVSDAVAGPDGPLAAYGLVSDPELAATQAQVADGADDERRDVIASRAPPLRGGATHFPERVPHVRRPALPRPRGRCRSPATWSAAGAPPPPSAATHRRCTRAPSYHGLAVAHGRAPRRHRHLRAPRPPRDARCRRSANPPVTGLASIVLAARRLRRRLSAASRRRSAPATSSRRCRSAC